MLFLLTDLYISMYNNDTTGDQISKLTRRGRIEVICYDSKKRRRGNSIV